VGTVNIGNNIRLLIIGEIMDIFKSWFGILPEYKLCRVTYPNGVVVTNHADIETISALLYTGAAGIEIEVIG